MANTSDNQFTAVHITPKGLLHDIHMQVAIIQQDWCHMVNESPERNVDNPIRVVMAVRDDRHAPPLGCRVQHVPVTFDDILALQLPFGGRWLAPHAGLCVRPRTQSAQQAQPKPISRIITHVGLVMRPYGNTALFRN